MRTLNTGKFIPESVVMPVGFQDVGLTPEEWLGNKTRAHHKDNVGVGSNNIQEIAKTTGQEAVYNPGYITSLQVGVGFNHRVSMDMTEEMTGTAVPLTNVGRPFFLAPKRCVQIQLWRPERAYVLIIKQSRPNGGM